MILLKLKQALASLLKDVLNKAFINSEADGGGGGSDSVNIFSDSGMDDGKRRILLYNARNSLKELGVIQLSVQEARVILNLRCDFTDFN